MPLTPDSRSNRFRKGLAATCYMLTQSSTEALVLRLCSQNVQYSAQSSAEIRLYCHTWLMSPHLHPPAPPPPAIP